MLLVADALLTAMKLHGLAAHYYVCMLLSCLKLADNAQKTIRRHVGHVGHVLDSFVPCIQRPNVVRAVASAISNVRPT